MRNTLMLVATLGSLALLPEPAAAGGYGASDPRAALNLGVRVLVQPAAKVVQYAPQRPWLRPQPVPHFGPPPAIRHFWHAPPMRHFGRSAPMRPFGYAPPVRHFGHPAPRASWHRPRPVQPWRQAERWRQGAAPWRHGPERRQAERPWRQEPGRQGGGDGRHRR